MDIDIFGAISKAYGAFLQSGFFYYIKIFSAFVSTILLIDVILLISKRVRTDMRLTLYGAPLPKFKKAKYIPRWEAVERRLAERSIASGKIAVIEVDKMLDEALGRLGYPGKNTEEKVAAIPRGQLVGIDEIRSIHKLYHTIIEDPTYEAGYEEIRSAVEIYGRVLRGVGMID